MNSLTLDLVHAAASAACACRSVRKSHIPGDVPEDHEDNTFGLPEGSPIRKKLKQFFRIQLKQMVGFVSTIGAKIPDKFPSLSDYNDPMASAMTPLIGVYWDRAGKALNGRLGLDPDDWRVTDPNIHNAIKQQTLKFCASTNATTGLSIDQAREAVRKKLEAGLIGDGQTISELTKGIKQVFTSASNHRARTIARTETARAVHSAAVMTAAQSGRVELKKWLVSTDSCPVCQALAAKTPVADLDKPFATIGKDADYSQIMEPPAHPNCRCSLTFIVKPTEESPSPEPVPAFVPSAKPAASPEPTPAKTPSPAEQSRRFPGLTITEDQVEAYTAHSTEKRIIYHQTYEPAKADLLKNGIDLDKANGVYGQGLYASTSPEEAYGPAQVKIALDVRNPLVGESDFLYAKWSEWSKSETGFDPARFSELAKARGYDAIVTGWHGHFLDEDRWFVICNPDQCRFVVPSKEQSP